MIVYAGALVLVLLGSWSVFTWPVSPGKAYLGPGLFQWNAIVPRGFVSSYGAIPFVGPNLGDKICM